MGRDVLPIIASLFAVSRTDRSKHEGGKSGQRSGGRQTNDTENFVYV